MMAVRYSRHCAAAVAVALLAALAVALPACTGDDGSASNARVAELEQTVAALAGENATLRDEIAALRQEQADFVEAQEAAEAAKAHEEEVADFEEGQEEQLAALEKGLARLLERLDNVEARLQGLEGIAAKVTPLLALLDPSAKGEGGSKPPAADDVVERTARLAEAFGGEVYHVDHAGRGDRTVLVMPLDVVPGETPLIVSLHGFGGDSYLHSTYLPLHERVNTDGFGLLLPNGAQGPDGSRFWNPTDVCCEGGKSGLDDVAYLTELIADARAVKGFGPVYVIGYSNGGFMAHHMACKGLPGLGAGGCWGGSCLVPYSSCEGAPPVSVLHIHGTADDVLRFDGDVSARILTAAGVPAFYVGAREIVARWSRHAGCEWPENTEPYATLDLDQYVPGAETRAFRQDSGCAEGVTVELWEGEGTGHLPGYGAGFVDALLEWLLARG
ncbi:MAG: hypothetical protein OXN15_00795 [Chloroflexota bacterium]|nr:hypothetical protein [Chloroflexota bacterium]